MTQILSTRNALRLAVVAAAAGLGLAPTAALAVDPLPLPSAGLPLDQVLAPSPAASPSPSPSPTRSPSALDPVTSQLPEPVREPVQELADSLTAAAPAPAPAPPGAAPAPAPAPGTQVGNNSSTSAQQVGAPGAAGGTGFATFPGLSVGTYSTGIGMSGLPPLAAGMRTATLNRLLGVPNVAEPITFVPQAAPKAPSAPVPAGLPALIVVVALVTVGGAAAGHLGVLQSRRATAAG